MAKCCLVCGEQEQVALIVTGEIYRLECKWCSARFRITRNLFEQLSFGRQKVKGFEAFYKSRYSSKVEALAYGQPLPVIGLDVSYD
ncbi:hypothetical protein [Candidatus Odyssella thessalonicensis]|uniref:hypothetical protein n=1 Tax=Candidatus Odyssella thessalonicensis TaxID=84647 RepID=UPI000225B482|nr:hypothetical protein [Candidatus Odyssella thessalonicensis]